MEGERSKVERKVERSSGERRPSGPSRDKAAGRRLKLGKSATEADGRRDLQRATEVEESSRSKTGRVAVCGLSWASPWAMLPVREWTDNQKEL
jgi:hypothetical protein